MREPDVVESRTEMEQILREEGIGYLGVAVEGQPYVVPLNYIYRDGKILFHCALAGQKLDAIRRPTRPSASPSGGRLGPSGIMRGPRAIRRATASSATAKPGSSTISQSVRRR